MTLINETQVWTAACRYDFLTPNRGVGVLLPDGAQKYGLVEDIAVGPDGLVHAPAGPGLGAAIDFGLIERKTIAVLA